MIRLIPVLLLLTTVFFTFLVIRDRLRERNRLVEEWILQGRPQSRGAFVRAGLRNYDRKRRNGRYLLVYLLPLGAVSLLLYLTNFS